MQTKRQARTYSPAFKSEALALIKEQGYSVTEASSALGVRANVLYRWKQEAEDRDNGASLSVDERQELLALRRENKTLRMEKEILKKASTFFAKEMK